MKFQPIKDRVLIKRDSVKTRTGQGLIIPELAQQKEATGIVVALGTDSTELFDLGDKVLFGVHDGVKIDPKYVGEDNEEYILIRAEQVRAILYDI